MYYILLYNYIVYGVMDSCQWPPAAAYWRLAVIDPLLTNHHELGCVSCKLICSLGDDRTDACFVAVI